MRRSSGAADVTGGSRLFAQRNCPADWSLRCFSHSLVQAFSIVTLARPGGTARTSLRAEALKRTLEQVTQPRIGYRSIARVACISSACVQRIWVAPEGSEAPTLRHAFHPDLRFVGERFFRNITVYLREGSFSSVRELESSISTCLALRNAQRLATSGTPRGKIF